MVEAKPQEFVHEECRKLGTIKFDFADKGSAINYCVSLSSTMQRFEKPEDVEHLLRHRYIADDFDKARVAEYAAHLAKPENTQIYLTSQSFDSSTLLKKEKWYKIEYSSERYSESLMKSLKEPKINQQGKKLDLPPPNTLLPTNFDILAEDASKSALPLLLETFDNTEVWYKKDDRFKRPKGIVSLKLYTNDCAATKLEGRLFVELWSQCLNEFTREFTYMADCAGLKFNHFMMSDNVSFDWSGYNDSLPNFIVETVQQVKKMKVADIEEIFNDKKEKLLQNYKNHYLQQTFRLAWGQVSYHLQEWNVERSDMRVLLEKYTYADFKKDMQQWITSGRFVWGFFGNISTEDVMSTVKSVRDLLPVKNTEREDLTPFKVVSLPEGEQRIDFPVEDPTNENSCLVSYFQQGLIHADDIKAAKFMDLTCQFLDEPTFNQLRTIEQLGYVVFTRCNSTRDVQGLQFCVQSPQKCCSHIRNSLDTHLA